MDNLDFESKVVTTPVGLTYQGLVPSSSVCGVIVLRSGGVFETGLKRVVPDCQMGRILVQSNIRTGEPELHHLNLPWCVAEKHVLVLDPQIATGAAALMSVQVLKDHGVKENRIIFLTYMASPVGLRRLNAVFPDVKIVVAGIEEGWAKRWVDDVYYGC